MRNKILVVDDDQSILDAISMVLEDAGYSIRTMLDGSHLQKQISTFKPDIILLDVLLSGYDGTEIAKQLKSDIKTKKIPLIMISAHLSAKEKALKNGANHFLSKPFSSAELLSSIKTSLKN